ncbi:MAG: amidohydrolase [Acidobacteriota bacterium]|nr:amidohydrolase [Acidobacteriota bacterium]MDQ5838366.1 amidohydrolase [Acidobacteriota bacterium]
MKRLVQAVFLALLLPFSVCAQQTSADLILVNGRVFTADAANPSAEAVAIKGGRIVAVGSSAEVEKLAGAATRRVDLAGRVVVPGFNDAHFHFMPDPEGTELQFKTLEPGWDEIVEGIRAAVEHTPAGTWIFGRVGNLLELPDASRASLDRIAPVHPVLLRTFYGHGYVLNSKAMPLLRIADEEPNPAGGYYERVAGTNRINGRLWEYAEWKPNRVLVAQVTDDEAIRALREMSDEAVSYGVTSMQVMPSMPVERFARLLVKADLAVRVRAIPFSQTTPRGRDLSEIRMLPKLRFPGTRVTVGGIKWILDGTPNERGAALRRDYADLRGWRGRLNFPESEIAAMVQESLDFRQQLLLHCVGDHAVEVVLNALESYGTKVDWRQKRVRIEHGDGLIDDLIPRARRLGVVVVQNPTHFSEPELFHRRWGGGMFPLRTLLEAGIPLALGSDGPLNPYLNLMFAAAHPYNPKEAITREQAVRAYTYGSAFAEFAEGEKGTIAKGKQADLVVLSQDIFSVDAPELPKTRSVLTVVGGRVVYDAKVLK